jgi:hypothetical protein
MPNTGQTVQDLSQQDFLALGVNDIAYIKTVQVDGQAQYAIYAADGTEMTVLANRDVAFAAVVRNDMEPLSVH